MGKNTDWPAYRHDNRRSGASEDTPEVATFTEAWSWHSAHPPQPAWSGPANYDAYREVRRLRSMRNYDPVFHVTAASGRAFARANSHG